MDPVHPIFAVALTALALGIAWVLTRRFGAPPPAGSFSSLEGLRGFLAFFVMVHHACFWFYYLHSYRWVPPPSNLYNQLGQASVAMFFMITALLFGSKLLEPKRVDWLRLYTSRVLRLTPMNLLAVACLVLVVWQQSEFRWLDPASKLFNQIGAWLLFSIPGMQDINGVSNTYTIIAGVTWSLPYEVFFYCALPVLALLVRPFQNTAPWPSVIVWAVLGGALATVIWQAMPHQDRFLHPFIPGLVAAFVTRWPVLRRWLSSHVASVVALACVTINVWWYPSAFETWPLVLLGVAFTIVACGNTLFGVLNWPAARWLGRIGYSLYLLHGLALFIAYKVILGKNATWLTTVQHWGVAAACVLVVIPLASLTYHFVEAPALASTSKWHAWLQARLSRPTNRPVLAD